MADKRKGELMMVVCAVLWSISGLVMKFINWSPFLISGGRGLLSALVIFVSMRMSGYSLKFTKQSLGIAALTFINVLFFVASNKLTTAANAIVLQYTAPVFVLIITTIVLKRKLKIHQILTVLVASSGMVLFFVDKMSSDGMLGNIFATISGFFMGLMYAFTGEVKDSGERISGLVIGHLSLALLGIPLGLCFTDFTQINSVSIMLIFLLGFVQMGIPYALYGRASAMISGVEVSLISMIEPVLNPIWVALFYNEIPGKWAMTGGILIIGAVLTYTLVDNKLLDKKDL